MVPTAPRNSFIGRVSEIELVSRLLRQARLLTIMGTAGSGKTRLAYEVARLLSSAYPSGVFYCELAPISDVDRLPAIVAEAFNAGADPGDHLADVVAQQLGQEAALLILDNCEHLRSAVSTLISGFLVSAPSLTILATSRERLQVEGETAWTIPPLSLPDEILCTDCAATKNTLRIAVIGGLGRIGGLFVGEALAAGHVAGLAWHSMTLSDTP